MHDAPTLIADIGATHVRFALVSAGHSEPTAIRSFRCETFPDLAAAAEAYLEETTARPAKGLCAVATAVAGDRIALLNHPWDFSIEATRRALGLRRLRFMNDWTAQALGVAQLEDDALDTFGGGNRLPDGAIVVLGPGTGLGVSGLLPTASGWAAIEGEGGHVTFAPRTAREWAVAEHIRLQHGHCSAERIASGIGLLTTYRALCAIDGQPARHEAAEAITDAARSGNDPLCEETIEMFTAALASVASDLALTLGARGGVYLGGGVLPRLGALFDRDAFRRRFEDKGRRSDYLKAIATSLIRERNTALIGLAQACKDDG